MAKTDVKCITLGHVPPSKSNYFDDCFRRYARVSYTCSGSTVVIKLLFAVPQLVIRYQDTIVGQLFGVGAETLRTLDLFPLLPAAHERRPLLLDRPHGCHPNFVLFLVLCAFTPQPILLSCRQITPFRSRTRPASECTQEGDISEGSRFRL